MKKFIFSLVLLTLVGTRLYGDDTAFAQADTNTDDLQAEIELLKSENETLRSTDAAQQEEIDQLREDVDALQEEVAEIRALLEQLLAGGEDDEGPTHDRAELMFDINADSVRDQFLTTTVGNENGFFMQDAITDEMNQQDVETKYGPHDSTLDFDGTTYGVYGNLAVVYANGLIETTGASTDKENNDVTFVQLYTHVTEDELINALGEPTEAPDSDDERTVYTYEGTGEDNRTYISTIDTINLDDGSDRTGLFNRNIVAAEEDSDDEDTNGEESADYPTDVPEDATAYQGLSAFVLNNYLPSLEAFYNDGNEAVLNYLDGNALSHIQNNRDQGTVQDYTLVDSAISGIVQTDVEQYEVTANLIQDYEATDGEEPATITYVVNVVEDGFVIVEFK